MASFAPVMLETAAVAGASAVLLLDLFTPAGRKSRVGRLSLAVTVLLALLAWFALPVPAERETLFGGSLVHDALSVFLKRLFSIAGVLAALVALHYEERLPRARGEFHFLLLSALAGMFLVSAVGDFMSLFVSLELVTLSFFVLAAFKRDEATSAEAGLKLLVLGSLSAAFVLLGIAFVYGAVGDLSFAALREKVDGLHGTAPPAELVLGLVLVFLGLGFKIGMVPMQVWVPDVYQGAPTPVSAFLSVGSKAAGFALLLRLSATVASPSLAPHLRLAFGALAFATLFYGNLAAIPQVNVKRLMGYSSIGHCGYLLLGFAVFQVSSGSEPEYMASTASAGAEAVLFYLVAYAFTNMAAFLAIVVFSGASGSHELEDWSGLSRRSPILAGTMAVALLSLAGVPPLAGFFGKFMLLRAVALTDTLGLGLLLAAAVNIVVGLYYYLCVIKRMYIHEPKDPTPIAVPAGTKALLYALMAAMVGLGVYPGPLVTAASRAARLAFGVP